VGCGSIGRGMRVVQAPVWLYLAAGSLCAAVVSGRSVRPARLRSQKFERGRALWFAAAVRCGAGDSSAAARAMGGRALRCAETGRLLRRGGQAKGGRRSVPADSGAAEGVEEVDSR
jgi:hypothetical protein